MTRIVAGSAGGRRIAVPPRGTRPTSERVREAIFSRLEHLGVVDGAHVLDLYAGSGALGLEASSRGAARVTLVEAVRSAADVARRNVADLRLADVVVVPTKVERFLAAAPPRPYDLVLCDPPYGLANADLAAVLAALAAPGWLAPGAEVVVERAGRDAAPVWPAGWLDEGRKDYGETAVFFARVGAPGDG